MTFLLVLTLNFSTIFGAKKRRNSDKVEADRRELKKWLAKLEVITDLSDFNHKFKKMKAIKKDYTYQQLKKHGLKIYFEQARALQTALEYAQQLEEEEENLIKLGEILDSVVVLDNGEARKILTGQLGKVTAEVYEQMKAANTDMNLPDVDPENLPEVSETDSPGRWELEKNVKFAKQLLESIKVTQNALGRLSRRVPDVNLKSSKLLALLVEKAEKYFS